MNLQTPHEALLQWLPHRQEYLDEILGLEAPPVTNECLSCGINQFTHRCIDCFGHPIFCQGCCLNIHERHPYHQIEKWAGECFIRDSLYKLGLVLHLGHGGKHCPSHQLYEDFPDHRMDIEPTGEAIQDDSDSEVDQNDIYIVHSSGIFRSRIQYCQCEGAPERHIQLLRLNLFPSSLVSPQTVFTFAVLDLFEIDSLECKTSAMNFFSKLRQQTNNAFPHRVPVGQKTCFFR
jgi:hypothetical protein